MREDPAPRELPPLKYTKRDRRHELVLACAIAHGFGEGWSVPHLVEVIIEDGLPSRAERERMRDEALAAEAGDNTLEG